MRIEQLYYLIEVVKANSISRAAEKIFVTQQTISQALNNLEKELGVKLLIRSRKGIYLTEEGKIFYQQACQVLKSFGDLKTSFYTGNFPHGNNAAELNGTLTICCFSVLSTHGVKQVVEDLVMQYPDIEIRVHEINNLNVFPLMSEMTDAIAVVSVVAEHFAATLKEEYKDDLWYETLYLDQLMVCASVQSPLARKKLVSIEEVLQYPLALSINSNNDFRCIQVALEEKISEPKIVLRTADHLWIRKMVEENRAVSFLPAKLMHTEAWCPEPGRDSQLAFIPLKDNLHLAYMVIKSKKSENRPIDNLFLQALRHRYTALTAGEK